MLFTAFLALASAGCTPREREAAPQFLPADCVSTLVGTLSDYSLSTGNTYPATALPWGMNFWTPQTGRMGDGWTYTYPAHRIRGFKQTHQPSPWINDYGQFAVMPVRDASLVDEDARASWFSHKSEVAKPYTYKVYLADHDIYSEIAPTERAAALRFTFPESGTSGIVVDGFDGGSEIKVDPQTGTILGVTRKNSGGVPANFANYFILKLDKEIASYEVTGNGAHAIAVVRFATRRGEQVNVRTASSFISSAQARLNLEKEIGDASYDTVEARARDRWNEVLGRIAVSGGSEDQTKTFYSCLYRSVLFPRKFYEIDSNGEPVHYSPYNGEVRPGFLYTDTGFWDTFRALFPLLNLVYPDIGREIQQGLVHTVRESGFLPEWASPGHRSCMIGNNSFSVVSDAILKGINDTDPDVLYEAMRSGASRVHPTVRSTGRLGHAYYDSLGYIPYDAGINENVARTLEYSYDDWCALQAARKLGRPAGEQQLWAKRALSYRSVFDPESGLMRGRNRDGSFQSPFSPYKWGDAYTEGNAWHYTWSVFHDIRGLIDLMGGEERFVRMLDSVFVVPPVYDDSYYGVRIHEITEMQVANMGNYAHGNQPAQHIPYLYDYAGQPWKTQEKVRMVMDRLYSATPDGYCGDEDNGQTSAWYVFSAMGFYPVCPASSQYAVGSPLFRKVVITKPDGARITLEAPDNAPDAPYISSMTVNGREWNHNFLEFSDFKDRTTIVFRMGRTPDERRGTAPEDKPYSFSDEKN